MRKSSETVRYDDYDYKIFSVVFHFRWKRLQIANVLIIFWKTCMQIPGCIFHEDFRGHKYYWARTVFGISCLKTRDYVNNQFLTWDILCFISLLFHDRFLRSPFYVGMAIEAELTKKFSFK